MNIFAAIWCTLGCGILAGILTTLIRLIIESEKPVWTDFKYNIREVKNKVVSKDTWKKEETSTHDVELTFDSFKRFVDLNSEGWSWKREYGIYSCNPCFQPSRKEYYYIRFKTYKDYVKAAAYWHNLGEMKSKRKQELAEAKNTAEFLAIQKRRAKEAEEQTARQMRESEEQIMEILERLKNESVVPTLTPPAPSASVSLTDTGKTITVTQDWMDIQPAQDSYYVLCGNGQVLKFHTRLEAEQEYINHL